MCNTNCLTDWADELDGNQSDFSFLSDLIAYADDLVTAEPQLVLFSCQVYLHKLNHYQD